MMDWSHPEPAIRLVCFLTVLPAMMPGWWDRLFGTYRDQPRDGHAGTTIGLEYLRDWRATRLHGLLAQPLMNPASGSKPASSPSNPLLEQRYPRRQAPRRRTAPRLSSSAWISPAR